MNRKDDFQSLADDLDPNETATTSKDYSLEEGYLVSSPSCHIPSLDPFAADIMDIFQRRNYMIPLFNSNWNKWRFFSIQNCWNEPLIFCRKVWKMCARRRCNAHRNELECVKGDISLQQLFFCQYNVLLQWNHTSGPREKFWYGIQVCVFQFVNYSLIEILIKPIFILNLDYHHVRVSMRR